MADERVSYSGDNWRFTGEPLNGVMGLHGSVMLIFPTFVLAGMFWQFTGINPFYLFGIFWAVFIVLSAYASFTGFTPRETIQRLIIKLLFNGRYKV